MTNNVTPSPAVKQPRPAGFSAERAAQETIARLQRGILRLALAYQGQNAELDGKLKEFGTLIRGGGGQGKRQQLIDEIVDTIVSLDLGKQTAPATDLGCDDNDIVFSFLDALDVPETLQPEIERIEREIATARDRESALAKARHAANLVSEHLMHSPDSCADAPAIRGILCDLLQQIPVSDALVERVTPLRRDIESAETVAAFYGCATKLTGIIDAMRAELQCEVDSHVDFLRRVSIRLGEFDEFVNHSNEQQLAAQADTVQLSETIVMASNSMRETVRDATDPAAVRVAVMDRLDSIDAGLSGFVDAQTDRTNQADAALRSMTEKLRDLEQQTEHLREDLEAQHARVMIDPLTGILNRSGYLETGQKQLARWHRYGGQLSLAVIDLDHFKLINDEYGHAAGDRVLATVARKLTEEVRKSDIVCRYGGEEFVLILPETGAEAAWTLLDKLREHIEDCPFRHKDTPVQVTLSCGIAELHENDSLEAAFERADQAMYLAKSSGRNQVRSYDKDIAGELRKAS